MKSNGILFLDKDGNILENPLGPLWECAFDEAAWDYLLYGQKKKVQLFIPSPPYAGEEPGTLRRHGGEGDYVNAYIEYPNTRSGRIRK